MKKKDAGELYSFYKQRAEFFLERHDRLVSFGDMVVDRWEKARLLGFGEGASIYDGALVLGNVSVGEHTWIGPQTILDGSGAKLTIGAYCSISAGVQIYTHDSVAWAITGGKQRYATAPTSVGNNVYIGPNCILAKGADIGEHTIIGAQSLVDKAIPPYSVAWGRPAEVVGEIHLNDAGTDFQVRYF